MEDAILVARELGRLTQAVDELRSSVNARTTLYEKLETRVGKLENRHSWAHGALVAVGTAVGFLGLDRLSPFFSRG